MSVSDAIPPKQDPTRRRTVSRSAFCPRCVGDAGKLLVPLDYTKLRCPDCGLLHYTQPAVVGDKRACTQCLRAFDSTWSRIEFDDWESIPASRLCATCDIEVAAMKAEVEKGGVNWTCENCGLSGIFNAGSDSAVAVRESSGIPAPDKVSVNLTTDCPVCSGVIDPPGLDDILSANDENTDNESPK